MSKKTKPQYRGVPSASSASIFGNLAPWKRDVLCLAAIYVAVVILFRDVIFGNMIFSEGGDTASAIAWQKAMATIGQKEHVEPLWIPYLFGGMPLFGAMLFPRNVNYIQHLIVEPIAKVLFFGIDVSWLIMPYLIMGASMFLLARQLKFSRAASLLAAITVALNPYAVGLPETGHGSKLVTLSYIPILFLLTHSLFERPSFLGIGLFAAAVATMLLALHPQMAFYGLLVIGCYALYRLVLDARTDTGAIVRKTAFMVLGLVLGFSIYAYQYLPTTEYAQYSIRGGGVTGVAGGLSYDYATNWSFHPFEIMNYVIPSFFGLRFFGDKMDLYWGWMPFTNSAVYVGLIPLILGIIALVYRRNRMTWFLAIISGVILLMSFGKHFGILFNLFFDYLPNFNKFRAPSMILHLIPITFGLLAAYGFAFFEDLARNANEALAAKVRKRLTTLLIVIGALFLIGIVFNDAVFNVLSGFMFQKDSDLQMYGARAMPQLRRLRFDRLWEGYIAFGIIGGAALGILISSLRRKMTLGMAGLLLLILTVIDLMLIDVKYINPRPNTAVAEHFQPDPTLQSLIAESDTSLFRVFPVSSGDDDNSMMYHLLQSVEGYSPAKLKIYQEMRDSALERGNRNVWDMLGVKYLVGREQTQEGGMQTRIQLNPGYLPRAWFVDTAVVSRSKSETFSILNSPGWNPRTTAIVEKELPVKLAPAAGASVSVATYASRRIDLTSNSPGTSLLVLSEIYYPAGWKATVDGAETEIFKTNHILRSVVVPAGKHTVEFTFDPKVYDLGFTITQAAWGLVVLLIIAGAFMHPAVRARMGKKEGGPDAAGRPASTPPAPSA